MNQVSDEEFIKFMRSKGMNCSDYYGEEMNRCTCLNEDGQLRDRCLGTCEYAQERMKSFVNQDAGIERELKEIRAAITGLSFDFDHGMSEAYRQGFADGYELAVKNRED